MGADLILYMIPYCKLDDERAGILHEMVDRCPISDQWYNQVSDHSEEEARERIHRAIDFYRDNPDCRRDCTIIYPGRGSPPYLITGGMTWGDHPTEACEFLMYLTDPDLIADGCIYDQLDKWAYVDNIVNALGT